METCVVSQQLLSVLAFAAVQFAIPKEYASEEDGKALLDC